MTSKHEELLLRYVHMPIPCNEVIRIGLYKTFNYCNYRTDNITKCDCAKSRKLIFQYVVHLLKEILILY